jgi:NADH:ubiquinone oxidoreductase subunit K
MTRRSLSLSQPSKLATAVRVMSVGVVEAAVGIALLLYVVARCVVRELTTRARPPYQVL